ncbi:MAG: hypothetical protein JXN59_07305 [Anaerolineae bacterium]|nr:hypothetical protein [Anaerolineae bacterium]
MRKQSVFLLTMLALVLMLAACGPEPTPTPLPTDTPAPTNTPAPTMTPEPTLDLASLTAPEISATIEALEEQLEIEEEHLSSASGAEGATVQGNIDRLIREIRELTALLEDAEGGEDSD